MSVCTGGQRGVEYTNLCSQKPQGLHIILFLSIFWAIFCGGFLGTAIFVVNSSKKALCANWYLAWSLGKKKTPKYRGELTFLSFLTSSSSQTFCHAHRCIGIFCFSVYLYSQPTTHAILCLHIHSLTSHRHSFGGFHPVCSCFLPSHCGGFLEVA